ncbi:hypothetical protein Tco_1071319 [Tanacetum coccineum]
MYKEYLAEFWYSSKALENSKVSFFVSTGGIYGEVRVNTFKNAIGAHYLPHSSKYVAPSSIDIVRIRFETIGYGETVPSKGTLKRGLLPPRWREKVIPYTRFLSLLMMHKMKEGYGDGEVIPYLTQLSQWYLKLPSPQGTKPGAKPRHKKHSTSSKQPSVSSSEATKASTPVVAEMHKKDHQATGGPTSLGVTSEERANPQLSSGNDASTDFTTEADPKISAPNDSVPHQQGDGSQTAHTVSGTKVDTRSDFMDDEDQDDEPFITP